MGELIQAINNLSQTSWLDICAVVAPIILSVVAIIISINTARKQNKIALYQERIKYLDELKFFISKIEINEVPLTEKFFFSQSESSSFFLFGNLGKNLYIDLEIKYSEASRLEGDRKYAQTHGECNGRDEETVEDELIQVEKEIVSLFKNFEQDILSNHLKL